MKLYCWIPGGHVAFAFSVVAESEQKAKELIDAKVEQLDKDYNEDMKQRSGIAYTYQRMYELQYWETDFYTLQVHEPHEVVVEEE